MRRILRAPSQLALVVVLVAGFTATAEARIEALRWEHAAPDLAAGFKIHMGPSSRSYSDVLDVGRPSQASDGTFSYDLEVDDGASVYVAVSAYATDGSSSPLSNEQFRAAPDSGTSSDTDGTSDGTSGTSDSSDSDGSTDTDSSGDLDDSSGSDASFDDTGATIDIGADPNTLWYEDFAMHSVGSFVSSWIDTEAGNSMTENDGLFGVGDLSGNRVFFTQSTDTNIHSHYVSSNSESWSNYELRGRFGITDVQGGVGVTSYSQYASSDAYYRLRRHGSGDFELSVHPHADSTHSDLNCVDARTGITPTTNRWYRYRLRIEETDVGSTQVRAKVWQAGQTEPTAWQAECVDQRAHRPASGRVGVWSMGPGSKYWDDFEVIGLSEGSDTSDSSDDSSEPPSTLSPPSRPMLIE